MSTDLIIHTKAAVNPIEAFVPLSKFDNEHQAVDTLACISAGFRDERGNPVISRDGTIYVADPEGRAPGLKAILAKNNNRKLTIAMPSNNPRDFISQSYRKEGKTRLEAHGDESGITTIAEDGARAFHPAGTPGFDDLVSVCKVATNITFILAEYDEHGHPVFPFPDGLACYRLRTTSANTVRNLLACLSLISRFTGGAVAGFPLETSLTYRTVCDPKGAKRKVPLFVFMLKPPSGLQLDSKTFPLIAGAAQQAISMHMPELPAPPDIEDAIAEFEMTAAEVNQLATGVDPEAVRATFFAIVKGSLLDDDKARRAWMLKYTKRKTSSLATWLESATPDDADQLLATLRADVAGQVVDSGTGEVIETTATVVEDDEDPAIAAVRGATPLDVPLLDQEWD